MKIRFRLIISRTTELLASKGYFVYAGGPLIETDIGELQWLFDVGVSVIKPGNY